MTMTDQAITDHARWFRTAGPYLHAHRERTFVLLLGGEALADHNRQRLLQDIALLHSLGIRIVLCFGARPQIDAEFDALQLPREYHGALRITPAAGLPAVKSVIGSLRVEIEAAFSMGMPDSPLFGARIRAGSGNFVTGRPIGVRDGVDLGFTGTVRRIDGKALGVLLDNGMMALVAPLGTSFTGEVFNMSAAEIAVACAHALSADKLIVFLDSDVEDEQGPVRELTPDAARALLRQQPDAAWSTALQTAAEACDNGVRRAHLIRHDVDGALLNELFSRDGCGAMVTADHYESIENARVEQVSGLLELLRPLEESGTLVRRSRELLENEIDRFIVLLRDGSIIGCAALYPLEAADSGELACIAVHSAYRNAGRAARLLAEIEQRARGAGLQRLVTLTTAAGHWFLEHGFVQKDIQALPEQRLAMYNFQRNSKVLEKVL